MNGGSAPARMLQVLFTEARALVECNLVAGAVLLGLDVAEIGRFVGPTPLDEAKNWAENLGSTPARRRLEVPPPPGARWILVACGAVRGDLYVATALAFHAGRGPKRKDIS